MIRHDTIAFDEVCRLLATDEIYQLLAAEEICQLLAADEICQLLFVEGFFQLLAVRRQSSLHIPDFIKEYWQCTFVGIMLQPY